VKNLFKNIIDKLTKIERDVELIKTAEISSGGGGGVTEHGLLTGLGDDDHSQYLNNARHDLTARHTLGTVVEHDDHGNLAGLGDNDHPQYVLEASPFVRVDTTADQSIPNTGFHEIEFDRYIDDTHSMWDSGTPEEIVIPQDGVYLIDARVVWEGNSNGVRQMQMTLNGSGTRIWTSVPPNGSIIARFVTSFIYKLDEDDVCVFRVSQNSGSAIDLITLDVSMLRLSAGT
jgi:hypothetical protein